MESAGIAGRVHITEDTLNLLDNRFQVEPGNGHLRDSYLAQHNVKTYLIIDPKKLEQEEAQQQALETRSTDLALDSERSTSMADLSKVNIRKNNSLCVSGTMETAVFGANGNGNNGTGEDMKFKGLCPQRSFKAASGTKRLGKWTECGASGWAVDKPFSSISESVIAKNVTQTVSPRALYFLQMAPNIIFNMQSISQIEAVLTPSRTNMCETLQSWFRFCLPNTQHFHHRPSEIYFIWLSFADGKLEPNYERYLYLRHFPANTVMLSLIYIVLMIIQFLLLPM